MTEEDWHDEQLRSVGMLLAGESLESPDLAGRAADPAMLVVLNTGGELTFRLPQNPRTEAWEAVFETAFESFESKTYRPGDDVILDPVSVKVFEAAASKHAGKRIF